MKKIFLLLILITPVSAFAQQPDLFTVYLVKPKMGQRLAFENAYKNHIARYHKTEDKISVYEILTGPYTGYYFVVSGPGTFEDLDKVRADASAHDQDLEKNYYAYMQSETLDYFRFTDSLSFHQETEADKYAVNVRHIKPDMQDDYEKEQSRAVKILAKLNTPFFKALSFSYFEKLWDGSDPVIVSIRNLKDGFKVFADGYFPDPPAATPTFKDEYIKAYGTADWDKRQKTLDDAVLSREQYLMKKRNDLGSN